MDVAIRKNDVTRPRNAEDNHRRSPPGRALQWVRARELRSGGILVAAVDRDPDSSRAAHLRPRPAEDARLPPQQARPAVRPPAPGNRSHPESAKGGEVLEGSVSADRVGSDKCPAAGPLREPRQFGTRLLGSGDGTKRKN